MTATAIVSSRFPNPGFRADGVAVGDAVGVDDTVAAAIGGTADVTLGAAAVGVGAETLGVETEGAADVSEGAALGNDNGRSGTGVEDAAGTWY